MNIAVIGYGLIGKERIKAIKELRSEGISIEKIGVYDPYVLEDKRQNTELTWLNSIDEIKQLEPDWVVIATPHNVAAHIAEEVIPWGCKVLMEKPFCRSYKEAELLISSLPSQNQLWVGFNYRFFKGIAALVNDINQGVFGDLISINLVLGHGGSPGDEKIWKLDPERAGGGCLLDPGVHLLDLLRLMRPSNLKPLKGLRWQGFWKTGIDEEVHLLIDGSPCIINFQVSIVKWASTFCIQVLGKEGYGIVNGRGRSYGDQTYRRGKKWGWLVGKSQSQSEEFVLTTDCSESFHDEMDALLGRQKDYVLQPCSAEEALKDMLLYQECLETIQ